MIRSAWWAVRQPRYRVLAIAMVLVALGCAAAGTWQISRYKQKVHDNDALRRNAHAAATPLSTDLVPFVGRGPAPGRDAIRYRTVTASGRYLPGAQQRVIGQTVHGRSGDYVLTPLRTASGVLLVVRGFMPDGHAVPAPPAGPIRITGRLDTAQTTGDALASGRVLSINPGDQADRLGAPVYDAYLTLDAHQPGTAGLTPLPQPDLANPAGGAEEWQHLAYVAQWYVFALLALAAPFAISRHEVQEARERFLGLDPGADEYAGSQRRGLPAGSGSDTAVAVRGEHGLARREDEDARWERAVRLADRYGRSVGRPEDRRTPRERDRTSAPAARRPFRPMPSSATSPHRSRDSYHGAYNDYLWELALSDGSTPDVDLDPEDPKDLQILPPAEPPQHDDDA